MELTPNDKKVVDLLSKLKDRNGTYPSEILAARREAYLKQIANIGLGIGVSAGLKNAAKGGTNGAGVIGTASSKILETILIAAIAIEAGTAAYLYRDKIANLIKTYRNSSNVQEVVPAINDTATTSPELIEVGESPSATALTPSGTPSPELAGSTNDNSGNNASSSLNGTPDPNDNNGNHYGLTPKPVRTKDNSNNNNNDGGNSNNGGGNGNNNKP